MSGQLALSLWQPWASLVVAGVKTIETRRWSTRHRGPLLIHAAATTRMSNVPPEVQAIAEQVFGRRWVRTVPFGALIGSVDLLEVHPHELRPRSGAMRTFVGEHPIEGRELQLGHYAAGRFGWVLGSPVRFDQPLPFRGRQRLFHADLEEVRAFEHRLGEPLPSWHP